MNEFESLWDVLCQTWLHWILIAGKANFINFVTVISKFPFPVGKNCGPPVEQNKIPFTQGCFVLLLVEIGRLVLEKKIRMWKAYKRTDNRRIGKLAEAFSSGELKVDISLFAVYDGFGLTNYQNTKQSERIWFFFQFELNWKIKILYR